jgi:heat shock protein HtpX
MGNWFKTTLLLGLLTALIVFIGGLFGGQQGMIFAFILAMGLNFFSYWYSDKIVLRMYRAQEVTSQENPRLYEMIGRIAQRAALPMPRIYVIPPRGRHCPCRGYMSSRRNPRMPLQRAGIRNMPLLP